MKLKHKLLILLSCLTQFAFAQSVIVANGPGNTYELIDSIFAPGYSVVETPDCNHSSFGRHIDEIYDLDLNRFVFRFHIHKTPDNDRCINFDRQRNEIKTYDKSPDSLLGVKNEMVEYKWKFKLDNNFQASSSFTHLHQIKGVGGPEESMPLITLTARKGSPDQLELRHASALTQVTEYQTDLFPFKGVWAEATETILYNETGLAQYEILISKVTGGDTLFYYTNDSLRMWKTNALFMRPKWGIYRSLNNASDLRDEKVLFNDFSIREISHNVSLPKYSMEKKRNCGVPQPY